MARSKRARVAEAIARGDTLLQAGSLDEAEFAYQEARTLNPESAEAMYSLGCIESHRNAYEGSLNWAVQALEADRRHAGARHLAGMSLLALHRYAEALDHLRRLKPTEEVRVHLALSYEGLGELARAEAELRAALADDPAYQTRYQAVALYDHRPFWADVHAHLARVLRRHGEADEARLHYHLAKRIDPTVELDPGYTDVMSREELEDHPIDRWQQENRIREADLDSLGDAAEPVRQLLLLKESADAAALTAAVAALADRERLLPIVAGIIHVAQHEGSFQLSAELRAVADVLNGDDDGGLFEAVRSAPWRRLLEIAEYVHAGRWDVDEALRSAKVEGVPPEPERLLRLLDRFAAVDAAVALPLLTVGATALGAAPSARAARLLRADGHRAAEDLAAAERVLADLVAEDGDDLTALGRLADVQFARGAGDRALRTLRRQIERADEQDDAAGRVTARHNLATTLLAVRDLTGAAETVAEAQRIARLANVTEYDDSLDGLRQVIDAVVPEPPEPGRAVTPFEVLALQAQAERAAGADPVTTIHRMLEELGSMTTPGRLEAAVLAGVTALDLDLPGLAEDPLRMALELATSKQWRDDRVQLRARTGLGTVYRRTSRYGAAIEQYQVAIRLADELDDEQARAELPGRLAIALRFDGRLDEAVEAYRRSIAALERLGDSAAAATYEMNLASTLFLLGRDEAATETALHALQEFDDLGEADSALRTLGLLEQSLGIEALPDDLARRYRKAAAHSRDPVLTGWSWSDQASTRLAAGDVPGAHELLGRAIELHRNSGDRYNEAKALLNRSRLLAGTAPGGAADDARQAVDLAVDIGEGLLIAEAEEQRCLLAVEAGDEDSVRTLFRSLTGHWAALRRTLRADADRLELADDAVWLAHRCAAFLLANGDPAGAADALDEARAMALVDLQAARTTEPGATRAVRELLGALPESAVAVTVDVLEDQILVGVQRPDQVAPEFAPVESGPAALDRLIETFTEEMLVYRGRSVQTWPAELGRLIGPALAQVQPGETVLLVAGGDLQQLPLHAAADAEGVPLVARSPVLYAPSIAALDAAGRTPETTGEPRMVSVGVAFPDEARAVSLIFGGPCLSGRSLGKKDVEQAVADADIVHFACHGYFDRRDFLDSGLLLRITDAPTREDILSLRDLAGWRLRARLVVLSACETGLGRSVPSDFLGLSRGLLAAGAGAVLVTLWPVDDPATQKLVLKLYRELARQRSDHGRLDVAAALHLVQAEASRSESAYDWAAFKLIGWPLIEWGAHDD